MKKLVIATLAATALVPMSAAAAESAAAPQGKPGVTWQHRGGGHQMMRHQRGNHQVVQRHHGGNRQVFMHRRGNEHAMRGGRHVFRQHHNINRHHYKRINRGFIVPNFWWGPRFQIQNWSNYGFSRPLNGHRWIRYYDDALLIDHLGRVHDGRWGMNWDRYADEWAYDDQGIPYYGDEDYDDYAEDEGKYDDYAEQDMPPPPPHHGVPPVPPMPCAQACAPGYSYGHAYPGHGYGYGWMHGGMVTITETTVHAAAPQTVTETVYIEKKVKPKPRRSYKRAKPRPLPGERG